MNAYRTKWAIFNRYILLSQQFTCFIDASYLLENEAFTRALNSHIVDHRPIFLTFFRRSFFSHSTAFHINFSGVYFNPSIWFEFVCAYTNLKHYSNWKRKIREMLENKLEVSSNKTGRWQTIIRIILANYYASIMNDKRNGMRIK